LKIRGKGGGLPRFGFEREGAVPCCRLLRKEIPAGGRLRCEWSCCEKEMGVWGLRGRLREKTVRWREAEGKWPCGGRCEGVKKIKNRGGPVLLARKNEGWPAAWRR
jgi:hypothetical protein